MKLYSDPSELQRIVHESFSGQFNNILDLNLPVQLTTDPEKNLILVQNGSWSVGVDSNYAYLLSDYYRNMGDALARIESHTGQGSDMIYDRTELGILFYKPFIDFVGAEFRIHRGIENGSICKDCVNSPCKYPGEGCHYSKM